MLSALPAPPGGWQKSDIHSARLVHYLQGVIRLKNLSIRTTREMQTLAQVLDALLEGNLELAGDTAIQRFKAVEMALEDGWESAQHLELIPMMSHLTASERERRDAVDTEVSNIKAAATLARARGGAKGKNRHKDKDKDNGKGRDGYRAQPQHQARKGRGRDRPARDHSQARSEHADG